MTDSVTVEQCDREAAADVWRDYVARIGECMAEKAIRSGACGDDAAIIQAFARHRIAERERCAGIAEDFGASPGTMGPALVTRRAIAQAIRKPKP